MIYRSETHCLDIQALCSNANSAIPILPLKKSICFLNCAIESSGALCWNDNLHIWKRYKNICFIYKVIKWLQISPNKSFHKINSSDLSQILKIKRKVSGWPDLIHSIVTWITDQPLNDLTPSLCGHIVYFSCFYHTLFS